MPSLKTKITTPLLKESRLFYEETFGMSLVEEWDSPEDRGVILQFESGSREALLEIYYGGEAHDFSGLSLQFKVEDVDSFVAGLSAKAPYEGPVERPWGSRYVYLTDPNDISVIVYDGGW